MTESAPADTKWKISASVVARVRNVAPVVLSILLFALGIFALYRLLKPVHLSDVVAEARATPWATLMAAFGATMLGYVALIGYDWSALRYLGKKLPARVIALGGFLGYSFGNTIGISVISGGAIRYRIYSAFGLSALEVASISTFVALAFGVGITVIGLAALAYHPYALQTILPLSPTLVRTLAAGLALAIVALISWLSVTGKTLRIKKLSIVAPSPSIVYRQLAFTLVDTTMAGLTLYLLLPVGGPDFVTFLAIFATALMAGVLSHIPGGVGVFESIIIAGLPADMPLGQVASALLLYRVIYYLVPFVLALTLVAINEARFAGGIATRIFGDVPEQLRPMLRTVISVAPSIIGTTTFGLGVYLLLMALIPSVRPEDVGPNDVFAAILLEGGALMSSALGMLLILLSQGLVRRISGAFWLTEVVLAGGAGASILNGTGIESAVLLITACAILWPFRPEFYRSAKLTQGVLTPGWFALVAGMAFAVAAFFFFVHAATPYSLDLWTEFSGAANTPRALRAGLLASAILVFFTVYMALQPSRAHSRPADAAALETARKIIAAQDNPEACLALSGDKSLFFNDAETAFIMYAQQGRSWVAYSDPVGPDAAMRDLIWAFYDEAYGANFRPVFYEITGKYLPLWVEMGFTLHKMGEEAVVPLPEFSLAGRRYRNMRAAHNKATKEGLEFALLSPPHSAACLAEIGAISRAWLDAKKGPEKGFSVGRFSERYINNFPLAIARRDGKILAFANIMSAGNGAHVSLDLMRYLPDEASGMMEFLFIELMEYYKSQGAADFSLGMAPLAGLESRHGTRLWTRFGALLFRHGGAFYNFEGLRGFKQKFHPRWRACFIAVPGGTPPLVALKDVALLISGGAIRRNQ